MVIVLKIKIDVNIYIEGKFGVQCDIKLLNLFTDALIFIPENCSNHP